MGRKQLICHITSAHPLFDNRIFHRECVSLIKSGFDVTLIAPSPSKSIVEGIEIIPLPIMTRFTLLRRLVIPWLAANIALKTNADLFHFHDPELIPAMRWLSKRTKKPVIWDAHESYSDTILKFNFARFPHFGKIFIKYFDYLEIYSCKNDFAGVVTITEKMALRYQKEKIPTCILSNYFDIQNIQFPPHIQKSEKPRIINTGSLFLERGVLEMADAFLLSQKEIECQIALWGNFQRPQLAEEIRKRILRNDSISTSDVLIDGPYPWKTLVEELIPTGWVGCLLFDLSDYNSCIAHPNRLFEYWANGIPVIANKGTEGARIVQEVGGGIVIDTISPQNISTAFIKLLKDPNLATEMGNAGRKAIENKYNWDNIFPNLLNFYSEFGVKSPQLM